MEKNKLGRVYEKGKVTDLEKRSEVVQLHAQGFSYGDISKKVGLVKSGCYKIVKQFNSTGSFFPGIKKTSSPTKLTADVMHVIDYEKTKKPSIYCREIRDSLLQRNICTEQNVPSRSLINRCIKNELGMSHKRLQKSPEETLRAGHDQIVNNFIANVFNYRPEQLHFFDEASVIRTAGNRNYGHSPVGEKAFEVQKYASNATYTINLCCGYYGLDYFNVIEGASNAREMLQFFDEALQETNDIGNPVFSRGDCIIMDNCGFHHNRIGEQIMRGLFNNHGLSLLFQPPYSPEFNVAEYIFRLMRDRLQRNTLFTYEFTELAIINAVTGIPNRFMPSLFRKCGYI